MSQRSVFGSLNSKQGSLGGEKDEFFTTLTTLFVTSPVVDAGKLVTPLPFTCKEFSVSTDTN